MISSEQLYAAFTRVGVGYFCGVPDSLLSSFGHYLRAHSEQHIVTADEGNAIALAAGHYLATSEVPLVYMQNSGLGNAINPLASLIDQSVWGVPMILLIGWRGRPGTKDEPQHQKQGAITEKLLDALDVPYAFLVSNENILNDQISNSLLEANRLQKPFALLVKDGLKPINGSEPTDQPVYALGREEAIGFIAQASSPEDIIVATTGKISRELYEYRERNHQPHNDLLVVGGMGHASSIALGLAQEKPNRKVYCLDGDGAVLMHMGALAIIGEASPKNLIHIVLNNGSHDSVGGQPTAAFSIDLPNVAKACGYKQVHSVHSAPQLEDLILSADQAGPVLIEIRVAKGSRKELSRPSIAPSQNKQAFMKFLQEKSHVKNR